MRFMMMVKSAEVCTSGTYTETNWHVNAETVRESKIAASTQSRLHGCAEKYGNMEMREPKVQGTFKYKNANEDSAREAYLDDSKLIFGGLQGDRDAF